MCIYANPNIWNFNLSVGHVHWAWVISCNIERKCNYRIIKQSGPSISYVGCFHALDMWHRFVGFTPSRSSSVHCCSRCKECCPSSTFGGGRSAHAEHHQWWLGMGTWFHGHVAHHRRCCMELAVATVYFDFVGHQSHHRSHPRCWYSGQLAKDERSWRCERHVHG